MIFSGYARQGNTIAIKRPIVTFQRLADVLERVDVGCFEALRILPE